MGQRYTSPSARYCSLLNQAEIEASVSFDRFRLEKKKYIYLDPLTGDIAVDTLKRISGSDDFPVKSSPSLFGKRTTHGGTSRLSRPQRRL